MNSWVRALWMAVVCGGMLGMCVAGRAQTVTINASQVSQTMDGFGANINHASWDTNELPPVLDALIDQGGMTLFRVVFDNADWETNNDNADPSVMDWDYYNAVYSSPRFEKLWNFIAYLNQRGISNNLTLNFQGPGPEWMGQPLENGLEEEWAEMIASALIYARNVRHLNFDFVAPDNEPDLEYEGIQTQSADQYVTMLHELALKLDANGLGDIRFVGPDRSVGAPEYMPEMLDDPVVMAKVAHFGVHSYWEGGSGSSDVYNLIQNSPYANRGFWMSEFSVWCQSCEGGGGNDKDWDYFRQIAEYLLAHIDNGASAGLIWEGYDSVYATLDFEWSYWGMFGIDDVHAAPKTYSPRKSFYVMSQFARFVRPGAKHIAVTGFSGLPELEGFYHPDRGQLTLVGVNSSSNATTLTGNLVALANIPKVDVYYTDANNNLAHGDSGAVTGDSFSVSVPANSVFSITGFDPSKLVISLAATYQSNQIVLSWPTNSANFVLETATNIDAPVWSTVTIAPQLADGRLQVAVPPTNAAQLFRLRLPP